MTDEQRALCAQHEPLAHWCARHFSELAGALYRLGLDRDEVVQLARIGIMNAATHFRAERGVKFSTYAVASARGQMAQELTRLTRRRRREAGTVNLGGCDVVDEAAPALGEPRAKSQVKFARYAHLAGPTGDGADTAAKLREAVAHLDERDRAVIVARFGLDGEPRKTLRAIAAEMGLSGPRVQQIQARALRRLRATLNRESVL